MNANPQPLDFVTLAAALAANVFSPEIARFVGPYSVIFISALLGAGWSSSRLPSATRWDVVRYMAGMVTLSMLITVPLAEFASAKLGFPVNYWFGPVSLFVGALGPDGIAKAYRLTLGWVIRRLWPLADD